MDAVVTTGNARWLSPLIVAVGASVQVSGTRSTLAGYHRFSLIPYLSSLQVVCRWSWRAIYSKVVRKCNQRNLLGTSWKHEIVCYVHYGVLLIPSINLGAAPFFVGFWGWNIKSWERPSRTEPKWVTGSNDYLQTFPCNFICHKPYRNRFLRNWYCTPLNVVVV